MDSAILLQDLKKVVWNRGTADEMWKKRIRIVVEKRRRVGAKSSGFDGPCAVCGCEVQTLTRQETAHLLQIGLAEVDALAASGRIHAIQPVTGAFRVCKQSLWIAP